MKNVLTILGGAIAMLALSLPGVVKAQEVVQLDTPAVTDTSLDYDINTGRSYGYPSYSYGGYGYGYGYPNPYYYMRRVNVYNYNFYPRTIVVYRNTPVVWTNYDRYPHTVTSTRGLFDSGILRYGDRVRMRFLVPGDYYYYCRLHPYMRGHIIVR